jgi:hypothetical protein
MHRALAIAFIASLGLAGPAKVSAAQPAEAGELAFSARTLATAASASAVAAASVSVPAKAMVAPYRSPMDGISATIPNRGAELPEIFVDREQERRVLKSGCDNSAAALCYDLVDRRVQYRAARRYMPEMDGLRAESVSVRHHVVVLKWTFR